MRYGTFSEERLLELAQQNGYEQLVLTDINSTSACLNFVRLASKYGLRPILGIDFRTGAKQHFVGIAKNNAGFMQLNQFLSTYLSEKKAIPEQAPPLEDCYIIYPLEQVLEIDKTQFAANEYIGVRWQDLNKLRFSGFYHLKEKLVVLQTVSFRNKKDYNIHRLFRAIDQNILLSKLSEEDCGRIEDTMISKEKMLAYFAQDAFILNNSQRMLEHCRIEFDFSAGRKPQNKLHYGADAASDWRQLKILCDKGLAYRYEKTTDKIRRRIAKELDLIVKMGFVSFFLINWDIVQYAKSKGYFHVGRGSGANSIVAYLLGITDVDPIDLDLYFERFLNLYRANPPDFDLDFSWRDRDDVTRYIFERFGGNGQVALLATYNTFGHSAAVRELGKVFGLPKHEIDVLSKGRYRYETLDTTSQLTHRYANYIQGMPNYLSIHAGGILISEKPIHYFTATNLPPKGYPTTHFDMVISEDVGLYKYDILGQRGLAKIKDAVQLIQKNHPNMPSIDLHRVKWFMADKNVNQMVSRAQCIGCFYVESPAMRMLLRKLEVDNYLGLVAASSIIRPGVAKSGMMREYIMRHKNPERRQNAHPVLWDLMPDTYGIMVYQEDVIKVAHYYGGLSLGEADVLRRGMSGKYRSREEFDKVKDKFFAHCAAQGEPDAVVAEIWKQIESFAGYAFAKGHSASYAVESYQSLYLKCYFPLEYMVATINNGGGFYRPEIYVHEARRSGGIIEAPDINCSRYETSITGKTIYLGFHFLQGLHHRLVTELVAEREVNGSFTSLENFVERVSISIEQLDVLIRINAFRFTQINKRKLLWHARLLLQKRPKLKQQLLFKAQQKPFQIPDLPLQRFEDCFDEIELLGFALQHPFMLLLYPLKKGLKATKLCLFVGKIITIYGYSVTLKNTKTSDGKRMVFGTFLDAWGDWIDTVHFPPVVKKYPFRGHGIYKLTGKVVEEFGFFSIEIQSMEKQALVEDTRFAIGRSQQLDM